MVCYLELDLLDNIMGGVYSENHKFLTTTYLNYCNILSSLYIVLSLNHMVYVNYFQINLII